MFNSLIDSLMRKVTITCMMPFYMRTILVIANDVKYFNNLSYLMLCFSIPFFLLQIGLLDLEQRRSLGFPNEQNKQTSNEYSDSSFFMLMLMLMLSCEPGFKLLNKKNEITVEKAFR